MRLMERTEAGSTNLQETIQNERIEREIRQAKAKEKGPRRFAADLFDVRQYGAAPTEGGISEDYVLGVGDRLAMSVYGSTTFEFPLQVDGRGMVAVPKVGTVPVAGMSLARARDAVQTKLGHLFARSSVDLSVTKLREVRVFVIGEVYRPGAFLVPNLSSLINVLSLTGGPTALGSYRDVRVMRGGREVHQVDLYPLRADGVGNLNFGFQNGDTVFVPLAQNVIIMEGAFTRVVATVPEKGTEEAKANETEEERRTKRMIRLIQDQLGIGRETEEAGQKEGKEEKETKDEKGTQDSTEGQGPDLTRFRNLGSKQDLMEALAGGSTQVQGMPIIPTTKPKTPAERADLEDRLDLLQQHLLEIKSKNRGDLRIDEKADLRPNEMAGQPTWLSQWLLEGKAPVMQFELRPGETVKDAVGFAGGFALQAYTGSITLRRAGEDGIYTTTNVKTGDAMAGVKVERGDTLTALPLRNFDSGAVTVGGWARIQGLLARREGDRLGGLLKANALVLPDTYMERGELVRTLVDGSKQFLSFDVTKALAGDPEHDLPLSNGDEIELYRIGDLRLPLTLTVVGPVTRPGKFEFIEGMRASDLLFRAGVPLSSADRYVAELSHTREGKLGEVRRLDLGRLISSVDSSPVDLKDDLVNPRLEPFDQLSIYSKPDFRLHRTITLSGQVVRPGVYELESVKTSLREIIQRAGGLTPEAMPSGGIFLRPFGGIDPEKKRVNILAGVQNADPTSNGINDILGRLNETKRLPMTGELMVSPLLHGLKEGSLNRMVVNLPGILAGDPAADVELQDGDEIIIPRKTEVAYVVGETASPFASFKVSSGGLTVRQILNLAGGPTRNADTSHIRLLKADGRIVDSWVSSKTVEPGDAVLVPQKIKRDVSWQENLAALTPLAVMINAVRR
jgi:protein involved in polysaccharide export with SLBB domain